MCTKHRIVGALILSLTSAACGDNEAAEGAAGSDTTSSGSESAGSESAGTDSTGTDSTGTDTDVDPNDDCVSDTFWTYGNMGSEYMHPGRDCFDCHQPDGFPPLALAGTVYTNAHELDECYGVAGVTVTITDAVGNEFQSMTNKAGNFALANVTVVPPYTARLDWQGRSREMGAMQTSTACNSCHTVDGNQNAPGRIMAP